MTDHRDALAEVALENGLRYVRDASAHTSGASDADLLDAALDIADAILASDWLAEIRAEAAREALREAAASMLATATANRDRSHWRATGWANWLRDRAEREGE